MKTDRLPYRSFSEASSHHVAPVSDVGRNVLHPKKSPVAIATVGFLLMVFPFTCLVLWLLDGFLNAVTKFLHALGAL